LSLGLPVSLPFDGTVALQALLGRHGYRHGVDHRSLANEFLRAPPSAKLGEEIVAEIFGAVSNQLDRIVASVDRKKRPISAQNWRLERQKEPSHLRAEVSLEWKIIDSTPGDWYNQVPVASGLVNHTLHKRCAIDLVRQTDEKSFDFIELKLESNTPLFAAIELLQYAFVWLLSGADGHGPRLGYLNPPNLLSAERVSLYVLAPPKFYGVKSRGGSHQFVDYSGLAQGIGQALRQRSARFVSFGFERFGTDSSDPIELSRTLPPIFAAQR
jgi:hypothetical protein